MKKDKELFREIIGLFLFGIPMIIVVGILSTFSYFVVESLSHDLHLHFFVHMVAWPMTFYAFMCEKKWKELKKNRSEKDGK